MAKDEAPSRKPTITLDFALLCHCEVYVGFRVCADSFIGSFPSTRPTRLSPLNHRSSFLIQSISVNLRPVIPVYTRTITPTNPSLPTSAISLLPTPGT